MLSFHRTISSAQAARTNAHKPGHFLDSELGQVMIETCLQLEHGHIVMQLIGLCLEIDVISSEQMSKDGIKQQFGPQFWYLILDKAQRREWVSLGTAVEVANRLWKVALQYVYAFHWYWSSRFYGGLLRHADVAGQRTRLGMSCW